MIDLLQAARDLEQLHGRVSTAHLQRKYKITFEKARDIVLELMMEKHLKARKNAKELLETMDMV